VQKTASLVPVSTFPQHNQAGFATHRAYKKRMVYGSTGGGLLNPSDIDSNQIKILFAKVSLSELAPMARSAVAPPVLDWSNGASR